MAVNVLKLPSVSSLHDTYLSTGRTSSLAYFLIRLGLCLSLSNNFTSKLPSQTAYGGHCNSVSLHKIALGALFKTFLILFKVNDTETWSIEVSCFEF